MTTESKYIVFGLSLTPGQKETLAKAIRNGTEATLRLTRDQLHGEDKLALTSRQIAHITKKKNAGSGAEIRFSKSQLKKMTKMGGFLPLIPLIIGAITAAGSLAGGAAGIAKAVQGKQSNDAANAEAERHNREIEAQLAAAQQGSGLSLGKRGGSVWNPNRLRPVLGQPNGSGLYLGKRGGCCPKCKGSGLSLGKKN